MLINPLRSIGIMARRQNFAMSSILILLAMPPFLAAHNRKQAEATPSELFGHYTKQQLIDSCQPLLHMLVTDRDDLSITTDPVTLHTQDGFVCLQWHLHAWDGQGNQLVHIVRDTDTGRVCLVGGRDATTVPLSDSVSFNEHEAIACAQNWMRRCGYAEPWLASGIPLCNGPHWIVFLHSRIMKAQVNIHKDGSLDFARITPLHQYLH